MTTSHQAAPATRPRKRTALSYPMIDGVRHKLVATYGIEQIRTGRPYFSLTGELYEPRSTGYYQDEPQAAGQLGDILTEHMPWLGLIADAHLCDAVTGEPIHARANAWYWFVITTHDERGRATAMPAVYRELNPHQRAAAYLGCDPAALEHVPCVRDERTKQLFAEAVEALRPQWRARAELVRSQYLLELPDTDTDHDED